MSTPDSTPKPPPVPPEAQRPKPVVVVPRFSKRDFLLVLVIVLAIGAFIWLAIRSSTEKPKNTISGVIKSKHSTGERETLFDVRPRKGVSSKTVDTGYYLKVFVPEENRTYEVIVEKDLWEKKKEGEKLDFLRPPDEQAY